jgi:DNA-binding LytR/AlgR family response regulator
MVNIAICDDVDEDRQEIKSILTRIFAGRKEPVKVCEYESGENMIADIEEEYESFDFIFQDIYMDGMTGVDASRRIREISKDVKIIFVTASPDFAVESYDVEASGYILKPFDEEKFKNLMDRLLTPISRKKIVTNARGHYQYIFVDEILWVESSNNDIHIHLTDGSTVIQRQKLGEFENAIDDIDFLRCHQSFLVNMNFIDDVDDQFHMRDGSVIPIRVRSRKKVTDEYHQWFLDRI